MSGAVSMATIADARREPIRVMVVDDSVVIRGFISRWIDAEADMTIVASVRTGLDAVNRVEQVNPDVLLLDIEMPDMDGIVALPLLLKKKPGLVVIMASTLTLRNAEISFKAMSLGAADYIPKPENARETLGVDGFRRDLIQKIRHLTPKRAAKPGEAVQKPSAVSVAAPVVAPRPAQKLALRPVGSLQPRVLLIGSSTGGPQALMQIVPSLVPIIDRVPVLLTQHMPPTFTTILAEHLARASGRVAREARDGEAVVAGRIYVAPGGFHMRTVKSGNNAVAIQLEDGPKINFCKPAVDPLFQSATEIWHGGVTALVLTGMGHDGLRGGQDIVAAGGNVVAQDEASSVVWGMPGAVANAGICCDVLPLHQISQRLVRLFAGDRS